MKSVDDKRKEKVAALHTNLNSWAQQQQQQQTAKTSIFALRLDNSKSFGSFNPGSTTINPFIISFRPRRFT
ncbi:unnamed protein product [Sympodiomycopsis kandeliae]